MNVGVKSKDVRIADDRIPHPNHRPLSGETEGTQRGIHQARAVVFAPVLASVSQLLALGPGRHCPTVMEHGGNGPSFLL